DVGAGARTQERRRYPALIPRVLSVDHSFSARTIERRGGWRRRGLRPAGLRFPPESRPQLFRIARLGRRAPSPATSCGSQCELRSGEWVTESGRPGAAPATGPARLTRDPLVG